MVKEAGIQKCDSFRLINKKANQGHQYQFIGIFNERKLFVEGVVDFKKGDGAQDPGQLEFSQLKVVLPAEESNSFWDYHFIGGPQQYDIFSVLVGSGASTASVQNEFINFNWRSQEQGKFQKVVISTPPSMITNKKHFPKHNLKLRSHAMVINSIRVSPAYLTFQEGPAPDQSYTNASSPFVVYSNLFDRTVAEGLIQGVIDLTQIKGLENLRFLKDFRVYQTSQGDTDPQHSIAIITYKEAAADPIMIASCNLALNSTRNITISNCMKIQPPNGAEFDIVEGSYTPLIKQSEDPTQVYMYGYNSKTDKVVMFTFDSKTGDVQNKYFNSSFPVIKTTNQKFNRMEVKTDTQKNQNIEIYLSDEQDGSDSIVLFNLKVRDLHGIPTLYFNQISDRDSTGLTVGYIDSISQVVSLKRSGFSVFMEAGPSYIQIFGSMLPTYEEQYIYIYWVYSGGEGVNRAGINVFVQENPGLNFEYKGPTVIDQAFQPGWIPLPISKDMVNGACPVFKIIQTTDKKNDFVILGNEEYPTPSSLSGGFYVVEDNYGLVCDGDTIQVIRPNYAVGEGFNPKRVFQKINVGNDQVLSVDLIKQPDGKSLMVTTRKIDGKEGTFGVVYIQLEPVTGESAVYSQGKFNVEGATNETKIDFNLMGVNGVNEYTWWFPLQDKNKVIIFYTTKIDLSEFQSTSINNNSLNLNTTLFFCPTSVQQNPLNRQIKEITSFCEGSGDSRVWSFKIKSIESIQSGSSLNPKSKQLNSVISRKGSLQVCSLGNQYIVLNNATGSQSLYVTSRNNDGSLQEISFNQITFAEPKHLVCLENYPGALIFGIDSQKIGFSIK